jgi:phage terminase large subunit
MSKIKIDIKITHKQDIALQFLKTEQITEVLYGGAAGAGKSFLGCLWIVSSALQYKGTRWLIGRKKLTTLRLTTLKTLFEVLALFKLEQDKSYSYNQQSNTIKFFNGSEIILKDLDYFPSDPNYDSLGSLEITGAFIDEVAQISEKAKNILASRIRFKLDEYKLTPKLLMTCNPTKGWLYEKFYKKYQENKLPEYQKFVQALPTDNKYLTKHYITQLQKLDEQSKQRLLFGNWDYSMENTLFDYDAILNSFDTFEVTDNKKYMTIDVARKNDKTVIFVWDGLNIVDGLWFNYTDFKTQITKIQELITKYNINSDNILVDSDGIGSPLNDFINTTKEFHNNAKPFNDENYNNLKSQLYFKLAEYINENKIKINEELFTSEEKFELIVEVQNHKQEDVDKDGKVKITSKDKIKQIIGRSPDFADALMMRMYFEYAPDYSNFDYEFSVV